MSADTRAQHETMRLAGVPRVLCISAVAGLLLFARAVMVPAKSAASIGDIAVAVTVDDLPRNGPDIPGLSRLAIHQKLLRAFAEHRLPPVYGFVNGGKLREHPEDRAALAAW